MATKDFEFGLDSFVPISVDESGQELSGDVVIRNTVEEAVLADAVGIDSFNIAEHYRSDMMDSAGHVILAAIAGRTERIRLGTAVTVLSTQDPVRVYTEFATLDAVSNGRAQLIVGRGSLTESFPLFGYDLADYEDIFEEKLELLTRLLRDQPVTWSGKFRSPLTNQSLSPPLPEGHLPTWVGVGGSPQSVVRAARYGLPLMLAVIGGPPIRFAPLVDLYRRALEKYGFPQLRIGMHSHGYVARTDQEAAEIQWPHWAHVYEGRRGRARMGASDKGSVPSRDRRRVAVPRVAGDRGHQDRLGHPSARVESVRPGLRHRAGTARTEDGDHRALRSGGGSASEGTSGGDL